jgi:predicted Zn-dependent peptidase
VEAELQSELDEAGHDTDLSNLSRDRIWDPHPMGRRITGSVDVLNTFTVEWLKIHHANHYVGSNMVVCLAGCLDPANIHGIAADFFGPMRSGAMTLDGQAPRFAPKRSLLVQDRPGSQLSVQLSFAAPPDTHQDFCAAALLASILDDGMGSRLPHALCERRGLIYELTSGLDCYSDCGVYDIELQVAPQRAAGAIAATLEVLKELLSGGISAQELEAVRQRHLHELEFRVDSTDEMAQQFAVSSLFNKRYCIDDEVQRLQAVTTADLSRVARRLFDAGQIHTTLQGPVKRADMPRIEDLVTQLGCTSPGYYAG